MKPALLAISLLSTLACSGAGADPAEPAAAPSARDSGWPRRVLVTNDNGIDDVAIVDLARALAQVTETWVVAATTDRSGTSNLLTSIRAGEFRVERRELGEGIEAYALDGYPADCVLFAVAGPMRDQLPDLVISGINGGPNLGDAWFGSGTIGAARTAAYFGIPAVAISGVEDDDPEAVRAAVQWVVELVRSDAVRGLRPPQYLTVSLPLVDPAAIAGVEVVTRARGLFLGGARPRGAAAPGEPQTWQLDLEFHPELAPEDSDVAASGRTVRYHGILAPAASCRDDVIPEAPAEPERDLCHAAADDTDPAVRERRLSWSSLLARVFALDALRCPRCSATMRIMATLHAPESVRKILDCVGLSSRPPPVAPPLVRPDPENQDWDL